MKVYDFGYFFDGYELFKKFFMLKKLCLLLIWNSIGYTPFSGYAQCTQDEFLDSPKPVDLFLAILHVLEENSRLF